MRPTPGQLYALALRDGMLRDGATMDDVRARYVLLLEEHGYTPTTDTAGRPGVASVIPSGDYTHHDGEGP